MTVYFKTVPAPEPPRELATAEAIVRRVETLSDTDSASVRLAIEALVKFSEGENGTGTILVTRAAPIAKMFRALADVIENELEA